MAFYSDELIEKICEANDIVDVISQNVKLVKKGNSYFGLCPFHNEKSASFSVTPSKQMYYCFGCGAGGNVITFVRQYENYSFKEAVEYLADRVNIELPKTEYSEEEKKKADLRSQLLEVNKAAAKYYYYCLRENYGKRAYDYLKARELSDETIKKFGLGYAKTSNNALNSYLKKNGFKDEILRQSGLFKYDEKNGVYDKFWNRVIFPIMDVNSRVIGFGGRVMGDGEPKYLNSPETKIFDKSRNLYGLNFARTSRKNYIIICEGYMDVIALHQAGITNAVASLGTAFTYGHASLIKRYTDEVYLSYDSDGAGKKAALRAIPILKEAGLRIKVINMEPYKDPDEFIKNLGVDEYYKRIDNAINGFMFEIQCLESTYNLNDPEEKTEFHNAIAKKLTGFSEELERNNYIEAVAKKYSISYENLRKLVNKYGMTIVNNNEIDNFETKKTSVTKNLNDGMYKSQKLILTWMIEDAKLYNIIKDYITPDDFTIDLYNKAALALYRQFETGKVNPSIIINQFENEEEQREVASLFNARLDNIETIEEKQKALKDTIIRVKKNSLDYKAKSKDANDIMNIQRIIEGKKMLEKLEKLNISLN